MPPSPRHPFLGPLRTPRTASGGGRPATRPSRGLSMIESTMALAVTGVVLGGVLPGFDRMVELRRLESAAAQLETELQLARATAVMRGDDVRVRFVQDGGGSCYVVHTGAPGRCSCTPAGAPACAAGAELLGGARFEPGGPLQLRSGTAAFAFEPVRGMVTPTATITLQTRTGKEQRLVVNIMGRVRSCTVGATVPGQPVC